MPLALTAIRTKYVGETSKISVTAMMPGYPRVTYPIDHRLDTHERHIAAMRAYAIKLDWDGDWIMAQTDNGYVGVRVPHGAEPDFTVRFVTAVRMGDFYEFFAADAEAVSAALGIVLTKRNNTPMCGVPVHAWLDYVIALAKKGLTARTEAK